MKLRYLLPILVSLVFSELQAQDAPPRFTVGHYVVVASYRSGQESYAQRYTSELTQQGKTAAYGFDPTRHLFYVYLSKNIGDFNESIREMLKTRESGFPTAWVRVIKQETVAAYEGAVTAQPSTVTASVTPQQEKKTTPIATAPTPTSKEPAPSTSKVMAPDTAKVAKEEKFVPQILDNPPADPVYRPQILTNTPVFLSLYNPTNEIVIDGEVEVVDTERSKLIQKVKGNDYLKLPDPNSKSEQLSLIAYSFGYRKVQHEINYKSTEKDTLQQFIALVGNYYMVSFEMVRLHKGDLETLYNVYFYNNAAMMLPESKYELNKLLDMMKYNPKYKVVLHGHTNGNSAGPLITRGPSNDFFSISTDAKRGVGSAKDLSRERAEVIKDWLVTNGISVDRIEVKAWGGKRMIHEKEGPHERKNARVDVEVVEE